MLVGFETKFPVIDSDNQVVLDSNKNLKYLKQFRVVGQNAEKTVLVMLSPDDNYVFYFNRKPLFFYITEFFSTLVDSRYVQNHSFDAKVNIITGHFINLSNNCHNYITIKDLIKSSAKSM